MRLLQLLASAGSQRQPSHCARANASSRYVDTNKSYFSISPTIADFSRVADNTPRRLSNIMPPCRLQLAQVFVPPSPLVSRRSAARTQARRFQDKIFDSKTRRDREPPTQQQRRPIHEMIAKIATLPGALMTFIDGFSSFRGSALYHVR